MAISSKFFIFLHGSRTVRDTGFFRGEGRLKGGNPSFCGKSLPTRVPIRTDAVKPLILLILDVCHGAFRRCSDAS
jgi:hypothetical protein